MCEGNMQYLWNAILVVFQVYHCSSCLNDTGWIGNPDWTFCYKDMNDLQDFAISANLCSAINTTMAMPKNDAEFHQLIDFMNIIGKKSAWIYLARSVLNVNVFEWMDGTALTEEFWVNFEPNGDGDCVEVSRTLLGWNDMACTPDKRNTICQALNEITPTTELVNITTPAMESTTDSTTELPKTPTTESVNITTHTLESTTSALFNSTTELPINNTTEVNLTCYTYTVCGANRTLSTWELATLIAKRQADLAVVKSHLSSTVRRRSSAGDSRPSSVSIGVLGGVVIVTIYTFISLLDLVPIKAKPKTRVKPKRRSQSSSQT